MSHIFRVEQVTKAFAGKRVISGLDLTIGAGQTTVLIGASGCGKSTLVKLLLGIHEPDDGRIHFQGQALADMDVARLRLKMGYVVQQGGLFPHLTARDNIVLMARYLGKSEGGVADRLAELSDLTHFPAEALARYPLQLSGGQRQRVALMRALMLKPDILFLDEPLGSLDTIVRHDLQEDLRSIFDNLGMTVILVTHDMAEAGYLGDHIVLMADGEIVQQGTINQLNDHPASPFVSQFLSAQRSIGDVLREERRER